jgi:hypothetical protein
MDDKLIVEFEKLKERLRNAEEYERTRYQTDAPENKERAEKALKQVVDKLLKLWNQMSLTIELDLAKTPVEWELEIKKYSEQFLYPVKLKYFTKSQKVIVRLEPPAYWMDPVTRIINE